MSLNPTPCNDINEPGNANRRCYTAHLTPGHAKDLPAKKGYPLLYRSHKDQKSSIGEGLYFQHRMVQSGQTEWYNSGQTNFETSRTIK